MIKVWMLWFNFIRGLDFIFLVCFDVWQCTIMSLEQRKIKLKPSIKLNHNMRYPTSPATDEDFQL